MSTSTKPETSNPRFRWSAADCYLFDIDGTLLNSRDGVHYHAFHAGLRAAWSIDSKIDTVPVHGNTDIGILRAVTRREGLDDREFERALPTAIATMCAEVERNQHDMQPALCPDIAELLARLRARGRLLGVVSGNLEPIGWAKLRAAGIRQYFDFGSFSGRAELRADIFRAGIAEARHRRGADATLCIVGDTPSDIAAARETGVPVIAVATGIYDRDALTRCAPDVCVGCCSELVGELP